MTRELLIYLIECVLVLVAAVWCVVSIVGAASVGDSWRALAYASLLGAVSLIGWPSKPW